MEKTEEIKKYLIELINYLDGRGLVVTDDALLNESMEDFGTFENLKKIVTK